MPITPRFSLSQTLTEIILEVSVPNIRVSSSQGSVEAVLEDERIFHFYSSPYLLKLAFPEPLKITKIPSSHQQLLEQPKINSLEQEEEVVVDEELSEKAIYDPSSCTLTFRLLKGEPKEWPQLEMMARLLQPKEIPSRWLKEIVHQDNVHLELEDDNNDSVEDRRETQESILHETSTEIKNSKSTSSGSSNDGYGFANMFTNIFTDFCREGLAREMLQLKQPEETTLLERQRLRLQQENEDFDPDRYLGDLDLPNQHDYLYPMVMAYEPHWRSKKMEEKHNNSIDTQQSYFTSDETLLLATIPYPLLPTFTRQSFSTSTSTPDTTHEYDSLQEKSLWCGVLDLLFAYVYDHLLTQGEPTVESAWTISTLSFTLSWLDSLDSVEEVVKAGCRRVLVYPYFRNLDFAIYVWNQVCQILQSNSNNNGKHCVIRCLLQVRQILEQSESYYLGNKLYIDPFLAWLQRIDDPFPSEKLVDEINATLNMTTLKNDFNLDLLEYEMLLNETEKEDESSTSSNRSNSSSQNDDDDESESDTSYSTTEPEERTGSEHSAEKKKDTNLTGTKLTCNVADPIPEISDALKDLELSGQKPLLHIVDNIDSINEQEINEEHGKSSTKSPWIKEIS